MRFLKDFKQYVISIALIVLLYILVGYFKDVIIVKLGGYTSQTSETIVTTKIVKGKVDSLEVFNHYVKTKGIILNPKTRIVYVKSPDNKDTEIVMDSLKEFTVTVKDTLIEGAFTVVNNFKGDLISSDFEYKPLFPKYIRRVDTLKVYTNTTIVQSNERSYFGLGVGANNLQYISILGSYMTKKKWQFIGEYGKPLSNTVEVINGAPFEFRQDALFSVKIIKHF